MAWNSTEVLYLAMSWVATSFVPEQTELVFWQNAANYGKTHFGLQRSKFSMRDKWKKVQTEVNKWNGHYGRMKARYYTGNRPEETYVKFTHKAYFSETNKHFKYVQAASYLRANTHKFGENNGTGGIQETNDLEESRTQSQGGIAQNNDRGRKMKSTRQVRFYLNDEDSTGKESNVMSIPTERTEDIVGTSSAHGSRDGRRSEEHSINDERRTKERYDSNGVESNITAIIHRPVTKDASIIEEVDVEAVGRTDIEILQDQPRPAGAKAVKEAKARKEMDERRSDFFKMTETVERATSLWEKQSAKQLSCMEVESITLAMSVLDKTSTAYKNLESKLLHLLGE